MLKRCLIFIYLLCIFIPTLLLRASDSGVVINSFQISGEFSTDEYVELKNVSISEIDITSWQLGKITSSGARSNLLTNFPIQKLLPGETIIVAHADYSGTADLVYSSKSYSVSDNSTIVLYGPKGADGNRSVIDQVGYGEAKVYDGAPVTNPEKSEIYSRRNGGQDTDNNKEDFYLSYKPPVEEEPVKKNDSSEEGALDTFPEATAGAKIQVSEFMVNPEGSDTEGEWIEIYNAGSNASISGYAIADRLGSPKKYTFPKGTTIKAGQYLAFYSGKTPISLNNDGDAVEVRSPDGSVIDYSKESGKGGEGFSFAWSGKDWSWTKRPTPGQKNVIEAPSADELSGKKDTGKKGEVLALVDESQLPTESEIAATATARKNDQLLGYGLIVLAILGGISYTLYVKWEKIREYYYNHIRKRDHLSGRKIWQRVKGWRNISPHR